MSNVVVVVVGFVLACCQFGCSWFGWRCRDDGGLESRSLLESAYKVAFHRVPFRGGVPGRVVRDIVVVSVNLGCLLV